MSVWESVNFVAIKHLNTMNFLFVGEIFNVLVKSFLNKQKLKCIINYKTLHHSVIKITHIIIMHTASTQNAQRMNSHLLLAMFACLFSVIFNKTE